MVNNRFYQLGSTRSVIRELFEYGKKRKAEIGEDNVFDFSLGNPSIEPPESVNQSICNLIETQNSTLLHGYTSAQGDFSVRKAISDSINARFNADMNPDLIYMTCGAAASLTISLSAIVCAGESVLAVKPYFPEYKVFAESAGAVFKTVEPDADMNIDLEKFEKAVDSTVKAVILNSPNNPSGVVYSKEQIEKVAEILNKKQQEFGHEIFIVSDEPYREISYGAFVPYIMNYYQNTIVCYSYSKSLSLAGERIGYIAVSSKATSAKEVYLAVCGAGRALGFVCAPSLFQFVARENVNAKCQVEKYKQNRDVLCSALEKLGYTFAKPDGAFYLFVKAPNSDADEFCERAKKHELLIVSGRGFGIPTHARISYCVSLKQIQNSIPAFEALIKEYKQNSKG